MSSVVARPFAGFPSERLQVLDEVLLLLGREPETTNPVVVRHDIGERGGAAVVKVRCGQPGRR